MQAIIYECLDIMKDRILKSKYAKKFTKEDMKMLDEDTEYIKQLKNRSWISKMLNPMKGVNEIGDRTRKQILLIVQYHNKIVDDNEKTVVMANI